ncbi:MAG: hypothetical protein JKY56_26950 [Kofleriaceae bacterium]|nr:hypothetical protein [Kofleriaceae bacterium]
MSNKRKSLSLYLKVPLLAATLATGMIACDDSDKAGPSEVQSKIQSNLPGLLDSTIGAADFLEHSQQLVALGSSVDAITAITAPIFGTAAQTDDPVPFFAHADDEAEDGDEINSQEITQMLVEQLFNDANYQGDGNYAIPASLVCASDIEPGLPGDGLPGDGLPEDPVLDPDCVSNLAAIQPLIHVESAGDGLDFDLLIGPDKDNPLSLELRTGRLSVVADLAAAKRSAEHISSVTNDPLDLPQTIEGVVAATIELHGTKDVSLSLAIRSDIAISGDIEGEAVSFSLEATDPLLSLRVDEIAQEVTALVDLKRTQLSIPLHLFAGDSVDDQQGDQALTPDNRRLDIDWKGYSTTLSLSEAAQSFALTNIGLGDGQSTLKLDGQTFFALEMNADSGHAFDLDIAEVAGALPIVAISPELDLELFLDMRIVAEEGDEEVPASLAGETYVLEIDGAAPSIQSIETSPDEGAIKVVTGEMRLSSSSATGDIQVIAGQCLVGSELTEGEHDILGYLAAGDCP